MFCNLFYLSTDASPIERTTLGTKVVLSGGEFLDRTATIQVLQSQPSAEVVAACDPDTREYLTKDQYRIFQALRLCFRCKQSLLCPHCSQEIKNHRCP